MDDRYNHLTRDELLRELQRQIVRTERLEEAASRHSREHPFAPDNGDCIYCPVADAVLALKLAVKRLAAKE